MREAAVRRTPLTVIATKQIAEGYGGSGVRYPEDHAMAEHARQSAQAEVDKVLGGLGDRRPASVTVRTASGTPTAELLTAGRDADLIVVGSRGAGGFTHLLMGSVSAQVVQHARCPVAVVPPENCQRGQSGRSK
jgi:nucleotide-binding universal stress UspA family protein